MKTKLLKPPRSRLKGRQPEAAALAEVENLMGNFSPDSRLLIEFLHRIQDTHHQISAAHIVALAHKLKLSQAEIYEVATFYHHFDVVKGEDDISLSAAQLTIRVCNGLSCEMAGADKLLADLQVLHVHPVRVMSAPCIGRCDAAPAVCVGQNAFGNASLKSVNAAVDTGQITSATLLVPDLGAALAQGAYRVIQHCLSGSITVEAAISQMEDAGLRGLGGAGFPSGRKWRIVAAASGPRLMAVNIDEGEPGTFKDRALLERDPHPFLEGMLIAAWVVDVAEIYIYLRDEYHAIRSMLETQLAALISMLTPWYTQREKSMPRLHLRRGAGAYICGEESAMIESIEGKRGLPRLRPPYVAQRGLFGRPTLVHNMETLSWVPQILDRGAAAFTTHGRNGRKGLRNFSVSGRVVKPGVHLAPAGITLNELVHEFCGGMLPGHRLYGYLPGGASGGILPAHLADIPLDFDTLQAYDCFIGSAAIVVLSQHDRARDAALNTIKFFKHESCGQCTPCRAGTEKAVSLLAEKSWNKSLLGDLGKVMQDASICGLGQAAPNPFLSVMKYFPKEVE